MLSEDEVEIRRCSVKERLEEDDTQRKRGLKRRCSVRVRLVDSVAQ